MTDRVKMEKMQRYICNTGICIISIFIVAALIWRIQCSISYYDEVLNIYISYITAALGQRHLVENGYIFSMGDLFNLPFVYLFWRITGGTEGLVLFIRFVYLGFNLVLAGVFWQVFGKFFGKKTMLLFGLILITFFPGGMYTVSYDSSALFFSMLGGILLLGSEMRGNVGMTGGIYRYLAGVCHACMVYSYPMIIGVVLALLIGNTVFHIRRDHMKGKKLLFLWLPYCFGGMTVLGAFLVYVFYVGWENVFLFQPGAIQGRLFGRKIGELTSIADKVENASATVNNAEMAGEAGIAEGVFRGFSEKLGALSANILRIGKQIVALLNYMWIQQKKTLFFTLVMLIQWMVGLVKKSRWRLLIIPEILIVAFFAHTNITCFGGTTMYAYCFLWSPFLFLYLDKDERKYGAAIFLIFSLTSIVSFLAIGFTSIRTDKAHVGLYCGAICTFLFMVMIMRKEYFAGISLAWVGVLLAAICNIGMAYIDHFQGASIQECTYRMQKGVFKGMMTWEDDVQFENLKECLEGRTFGDNAFICMTDYNYYAACLDGNLQSTEGNFNLLYCEQLLQEGEIGDFFDAEYWPEVILIDVNSAENYSSVRENIIAKHYNMVLEEDDYWLYIKR